MVWQVLTNMETSLDIFDGSAIVETSKIIVVLSKSAKMTPKLEKFFTKRLNWIEKQKFFWSFNQNIVSKSTSAPLRIFCSSYPISLRNTDPSCSPNLDSIINIVVMLQRKGQLLSKLAKFIKISDQSGKHLPPAPQMVVVYMHCPSNPRTPLISFSHLIISWADETSLLTHSLWWWYRR